MNSEQLDALPAGVKIGSRNGNVWRKRPDGRWDVLTDPGWGPVNSADLPTYVTVQDAQP